MKRLIALTSLLLPLPSLLLAKPHARDYCQFLQQEIQGKKHGFLAGNLAYYIGGFHASWQPIEDETLGLTHPFHHDLRSRGVGLAQSQAPGHDNTGKGNDFYGWEFYKDTRVLYGSVQINGTWHKHPKPTRMYWRPDKMVCEYEIDGVTLREEKFVDENDAIASHITASKPVTLELGGQSFFARNSLTSTAKLNYLEKENALHILEGGTTKTIPDTDRQVRTAPIHYSGMSVILAASKPFLSPPIFEAEGNGTQFYTFQVPCGPDGTTVSWAMHNEKAQALQAATNILCNTPKKLSAKTTQTNQLLQSQIPQFRCSDPRHEKIYAFLWSIYLNYYIHVGQGWEQHNHTQTAVNNFLGIHRYDSTFQIKAGAWLSDKPKYAYGNVLTWKSLVVTGQYRTYPNGTKALPDNKGTTWHSGVYGPEASEFVPGAWQIYRHTGDVEFLKECYNGYFKKLFWEQIPSMAMNQYEVARILARMAKLTGNEADAGHWESKLPPKEIIHRQFENRWEAHGHRHYYGGSRNGMLMTNGFWSLRQPDFPREYARKMLHTWALDRENGYFGKIFPRAMAAKSQKQFATQDDNAFGYTPDTAYFTLDGFFRQDFPKEASELTLQHLENYNWHPEWNVPVAPEAYQRDKTLFGDQYSNFNAGKLLLYIEGLAGIHIDVPNNTLRIRDALPQAWDFMEFQIPLGKDWIRIEYRREDGKKSITVENSPLKVVLEPWLEGTNPDTEPILEGGKSTKRESLPHRLSYLFEKPSPKVSLEFRLK